MTRAGVIGCADIHGRDTKTCVSGRIYASVKKTHRLVIIHEAKQTMGIRAEIAASVQDTVFDWLDAPVARIAAPFTHIAFQPKLEQHYLPDAGKLVAQVKTMMG